MDEGEYAFAKSRYDEEFLRLNADLDDAVTRRRKFSEAMSAENKWITLMKSVSRATALTQSLVNEVIHRVDIHENGDITLTMQYADLYALTLSTVSEIKEVDV